MTVIEVAVEGVKPNLKPMDPSTQEGQILQNAWKASTGFPTGPHWAAGGLEVTKPQSLWGFFEFDSVQHHRDFARTFGAEAVKDLPLILNSHTFQKHIVIDSDARLALRAPVTQVLLAYFPSDISTLDQSAVLTGAKDTICSALATCAAAAACSLGWSVESDFPILTRLEDTGRVLAFFIGWTSVDAADRFWDEKKGQKTMFADFVRRPRIQDLVSTFVNCRVFGSREDA